MADGSGSGSLGALTIGGIAGTAVVLGGVVLFQLGVFSPGGPEAVNTPPQQAEGSGGSADFDGEGEESGQPLQNRQAAEQAEAKMAEAEQAEAEQPGAEADAAQVEQSAPAAAAPDPAAGTAGQEPADAPADAAAGGADTAAETGAGPEDSAVTLSEERVNAPPDAADAEPGERTLLAQPEAAQPDSGPAAADPEAQQQEEPDFVLQAPQLDLVRIDRDGSAVIAGRAQGGVQLSVMLDGTLLEQLEVPAGGDFVALASIAPSSAPQVISLLAEHQGQRMASEASFIVAPVGPLAQAPDEAGAPQPADLAVAGAQPAGSAEQTAAAASQPGGSAPAGAVGTGAAAEGDAAGAAGPDAVAAAPAETVSEQEGRASAAADAPEPPRTPEPPAAAGPAPSLPEGQAVAVLRADRSGIEVVQPAIPADPELSDEVALDAISYNGTGGVELSGRARPQSRVRVYVDNRPVAELETAGDGRWSGRLEDVAPGIYTLRLDEIEAASGSVVSRLETPFKREAPDTLPQPGADAAPDQPAPLVRAVTVQKGDTLWAISQQKYGSGFLYVRLFEANRDAIRNPDLIYPGQVFEIPE